MDVEAQLEDLKDLAKKLCIQIDTSDLHDNEFSLRSGYCKLRGKDLIILDKNLSPAERIEIILRALKNFDVETIYVPAWLRERLDKENVTGIKT
jgi:hypothetical protein